jgi:uncharacterized protein (DUF433 family)
MGNKPRIAGTRIRVMDVAFWHEDWGEGWSVEKILEEFPQLTAGDVHAALAYYHDNREEIEAAFEREKHFEDEFRRTYPDRVLDV